MRTEKLLAQNEQLLRDNARLTAENIRLRNMLVVAQDDYRFKYGTEGSPYDLTPIDCKDYLAMFALDIGLTVKQLAAVNEMLGPVASGGIEAAKRILENDRE